MTKSVDCILGPFGFSSIHACIDTICKCMLRMSQSIYKPIYILPPHHLLIRPPRTAIIRFLATPVQKGTFLHYLLLVVFRVAWLVLSPHTPSARQTYHQASHRPSQRAIHLPSCACVCISASYILNKRHLFLLSIRVLR